MKNSRLNSAVNVDNENLPLLNSDNGSEIIRINRPSMSWIMAAGLIVNAAMGAGLLNLPKAFDDAGGILISSILHAIVVILAMGAYAIIFVCCDSSISTFEMFVLAKCGKFWQRLCSIFIILYMYGLSITFFIIIGDQLEHFILYVFHYGGSPPWYFDRRFMIAVTSLLFILPLCFSKTIKFLQIPSMLGVLAIIYVVIIVPVEYYTSSNGPVKTKSGPDSWTDVFLVLPTMCFCYQAHVNAVPVFVSLKSRADCIKATFASTLVLILSYSCVAVYGYLTFGTDVDHDILLSYCSKSPAVFAAIIMVALKTYTAYPVNLFCARTAIDSLFENSQENVIATDPRQSLKRRLIIVGSWFGTTLAAALFLPNISIAIHYLGALAASFIFVFPGLCLYFHIDQHWISWSKNAFGLFVAIMYVAIGVFITAITLVQSLMADIHPKDETSKPCPS